MGWKPLDPVFVMKVMLFQQLYNLSDEQVESQISERTNFCEFFGIRNMDDVPDARTVWKYRDQMTKGGTFDHLFVRFNEYLDRFGFIVNDGK